MVEEIKLTEDKPKDYSRILRYLDTIFSIIVLLLFIGIPIFYLPKFILITWTLTFLILLYVRLNLN